MKTAFGANKACPAGVRASELDGGFDTFAAAAAEKCFLQISASQCAEVLRQFSGELRHVTLQHGWPAAVQFIFQRLDDVRVIVSSIVNAVAEKKIKDAPTVGSE